MRWLEKGGYYDEICNLCTHSTIKYSVRIIFAHGVAAREIDHLIDAMMAMPLLKGKKTYAQEGGT